MSADLIMLRALGILFSLVMLFLTVTYYRRNTYTYQSLMVWVLAWAAFLFVLVFPGTTEAALRFFRIGRILDALVIGGLLFFSSVVFYLYVSVKRSEKRVNELIGKLARDRPEKPKK